MNKTVNLNVRVSSEVKDQLQNLSDVQICNVSDLEQQGTTDWADREILQS